MISIAAVEIMALYKNINGKLLTATTGAIALVVGYAFGVGVS